MPSPGAPANEVTVLSQPWALPTVRDLKGADGADDMGGSYIHTLVRTPQRERAIEGRTMDRSRVGVVDRIDFFSAVHASASRRVTMRRGYYGK